MIHIGIARRRLGGWARRHRSGLARTLGRLGLPLGRLKTGTPPRLDRRTIDWEGLRADPGDDQPQPFSTLTTRLANRQIECRVTGTTQATHAVIRANIHRSAVYSGQIAGRGPRYCPSIEDKVVRFSPESVTISSWSRKAWTTPPSIRTASPQACPRKCSRRYWDDPGPEARPHDPSRAMRLNMTTLILAR